MESSDDFTPDRNGRFDTEQVLGKFRDWLEQTHSESSRADEAWDESTTASRAVGLLQWVEELTALRHEVKLLTKSVRGREDQGETALKKIEAAVEKLESTTAGQQGQVDRACQPLVETLIDLDEALSRGRQVIVTARRRLLEEFAGELNEAPARFEALYRLQPWWRRGLLRPWHSAVQELYLQRVLDSPQRIFDSLVEGYDLVRARLERTMKQQSIVRMATVGRAVDPNSMTVLEAVEEPGHPPGSVVEEIGAGYYWKGKIVRYAEVKAAAGG